MAISAIHILSNQGKRLIFRDYRGDVDNNKAIDAYISQLSTEDGIRSPVWEYDNVHYISVHHNNIIRTPIWYSVVALAVKNVDAAMAFATLYKILKVFQNYFETVEEESIRDNFVIIYELLDEMLDFGYPQTTEPSLLKEYIVMEGQRLTRTIKKGLTDAITGGYLNTNNRVTKTYQTNELFLDVIERVNLLVNSNGNVLQHDIHGELKMRAQLNGIPILSMGFNKRFNFNPIGVEGGNEITVAGVAGGLVVEDFSFHPCVDSSKVSSDRTIRFVPPDGEFTLFSYRLTSRLRPLIWVEPVVKRHSHKVEYFIRVRTQFKKSAQASDIVVKIPVPSDADTPKLFCSHGAARYKPHEDVLEWTIPRMPGATEHSIRAQFGLPSISADDELELKRPIQLSFRLPTHSVSGIQISYLAMTDAQTRQRYQAMAWIRYLTESGNCSFRLS